MRIAAGRKGAVLAGGAMRGAAARRGSGAEGALAANLRQPAPHTMPADRWGPGEFWMAAARRQHTQSPLQFRQQRVLACRENVKPAHWAPGTAMMSEAANNGGSHDARLAVTQCMWD